MLRDHPRMADSQPFEYVTISFPLLNLNQCFHLGSRWKRSAYHTMLKKSSRSTYLRCNMITMVLYILASAHLTLREPIHLCESLVIASVFKGLTGVKDWSGNHLRKILSTSNSFCASLLRLHNPTSQISTQSQYFCCMFGVEMNEEFRNMNSMTKCMLTTMNGKSECLPVAETLVSQRVKVALNTRLTPFSLD